MTIKEKIIQYLSMRRDYYKIKEEEERMKKDYNPILIMDAEAKQEALNEAIEYITIYM